MTNKQNLTVFSFKCVISESSCGVGHQAEQFGRKTFNCHNYVKEFMAECHCRGFGGFPRLGHVHVIQISAERDLGDRSDLSAGAGTGAVPSAVSAKAMRKFGHRHFLCWDLITLG